MTTGKIEMRPYRGHLEPIGEVRRYEIRFLEKFLEYIYDYTYTPYKEVEALKRCCTLLPKSQMMVELTSWHHEDDPEKTNNPQVVLTVNGSYQEFIYLETMEEAERVYKQIKTWLIE